MSEGDLDELLTALETAQTSKKLVKLLTKVRQNVDWPRDKDNIIKLRERGCLKQIVSALNSSKKHITDVSLSIIGNCCMEPECTTELVSHRELLRELEKILERHPNDESVYGRIFRIVGNMCRQEVHHWVNVSIAIVEHRPKIITQMIAYLERTAEANCHVSEATIILGIRALRELVSSKTLKPLVMEHNVMNCVGLLLIKYSATWTPENNQGKDVLKAILKLLYEYSKHRSYKCVLKLRQTEKGDAISHLTKILLISPKLIVKIVMNFLKVVQLQSDVPIPGLFEGLTDALKNFTNDNVMDSTWEDYLKCLCILYEHPVNRGQAKCVESTQLLVKILASLTLESKNKVDCCILILNTLRKCQYHEGLLREQIECGIVEALVQKIKAVLGPVVPLNVDHKMKRDKKNDKTRSFEDVMWCRIEERNDMDYSNLLMMDCSPGPESVGSDSEMAMSATSGLSPVSSRTEFEVSDFVFAESDSDDYSPVCSENEEGNEMVTLNNYYNRPNGDDSPRAFYEVSEDDDGDEDEVPGRCPSFLEYTTTELLATIVKFMRILADNRPLVPQLGNEELLLALIKTSEHFAHGSLHHRRVIMQILDLAMGNHEFLLPLMQTDFVMTLESLKRTKHKTTCSICSNYKYIGKVLLLKLRTVAESGFGRGDIAHKLLRGEVSIREKLVLAIPYIIRSRSVLVRLMMNCGGLGILMKLLKDDSQLQERCIGSLCAMASLQLNIANPKDVSSICREISVIRFSSDREKLIETPQVVRFKLDDGSVLKADRSVLCKHSDFFSSLLHGGFKESNEDEITLHDVLNKTFKCLVHLMECDIKKTELKEFDVDLNTHLDLIALCDRFLMPDFCIYLTNSVEKFRLTADSIPVIYQWSMESRTNFLRVECVAFALVAQIVQTERVKMFKNLLGLGYRDELLEDIQTLMTRYMTMSHIHMEEERNSSRRGKKRKFLKLKIPLTPQFSYS